MARDDDADDDDDDDGDDDDDDDDDPSLLVSKEVCVSRVSVSLFCFPSRLAIYWGTRSNTGLIARLSYNSTF